MKYFPSAGICLEKGALGIWLKCFPVLLMFVLAGPPFRKGGCVDAFKWFPVWHSTRESRTLCTTLPASSASHYRLCWPREWPLELSLASLQHCSGEPWDSFFQPVFYELPGLLCKSGPDNPWNRTPLIPEPDSWMHISSLSIVSVSPPTPTTWARSLGTERHRWETGHASIHSQTRELKDFVQAGDENYLALI